MSILSRYSLSGGIFIVATLGYLQIGEAPSLFRQLSLIHHWQSQQFSEVMFLYASLPRLSLAIIVGGVLGLVGSLLQQLTQNYLLSPMTLGASSGAWLGLVCLSVFLPSLVPLYGHWFAMGGAILSTALVIFIAGRQGLGGLPVILSGLAINLLLGAIATAIVMTHDQYAKNLFIWGAGDLTQSDWSWVTWLLPKLWPMPLLLYFAPRPLSLLRLGEQAAGARGLSLIPTMVTLIGFAIWMLSCAITAVGLIAFIGLLAPNIVRSLGARTARDQLCFSVLIGALLLLITDMIALIASGYTTNMIPSGTAAALIGAPALIWFSRGKLGAKDQQSLSLPKGAVSLHKHLPLALICLLLSILFVALFVAPSLHGWQLSISNLHTWQLRWPRVFAAVAGGAAMAMAGVILQRLIRNPLASPDILGMSAGATFALVITTIFTGASIFEVGSLVAFIGSSAVLALLLLLGRKHQFSPAMMVLIGIALAALIDALIAFVLAKGSDEVYSILGWLSGTTYRVAPSQVILLLVSVTLLGLLSLSLSRWLTLISAGDDIAKARGLNISQARLILLIIVALLCALVTAVIGPLAFVGLLAPHMAVMLGAKKAAPQLLLACIIGALLMLVSDWLGRVLLYPVQMPAGTIASILGGSYLILLLSRSGHPPNQSQ
ncbi:MULTISPECIES: Fe(3+)-hydroxamate ABC transporter permease FhuB [unclassified Agarivorans]|uniref:Fe(3+)-hydroxamate ABC transporter permease FhuB n=1 Tax=unclassified Agarivorans TaxID=2636026 RepID=UPI003D7E1DAF